MRSKALRFGEGFKVLFGNARSQAAQMVLAPGASEGNHENRHSGADQWLFVVAGRGIARVNGRRRMLRPGSLLLIERNDRHEIRCVGSERLQTLDIYVPPAYRPDGGELPSGKPADKGRAKATKTRARSRR